jgi:hypothetical protein
MSSPSENESMPKFNSVPEGSQNTSDETPTPLTPESSPEVPAEVPPEESQEGSPEVPSEESQEGSPEVPPEDSQEGSQEVPTEGSQEESIKEEESPSPEELNEEVESTPSEEGEPLEEPIVSESKQMEKDKKVVDEAATFRKKLTTTKKRLPSMDDRQKDEIRHGVIREFINILKISKRATTRKKLGRRINNLRGVFNETLDIINGTAKKRQRKRKTKKQISEIPPTESFSENQP